MGNETDTPGGERETRRSPLEEPPRMAGERRELHEDQAGVPWSWEAKARSGDGAKVEPLCDLSLFKAVVPCFDLNRYPPSHTLPGHCPHPGCPAPAFLHCLTLARPCRMLYGPGGEVLSPPSDSRHLHTHLVCQNNSATVTGFRPGWGIIRRCGCRACSPL